MKSLVLALACAGAVLSFSAAHADIVVNDGTKVVSYKGNSSTTYFGSSSQGDVIGAHFDTKKVVISESGNSITLKYYTQFDGDELGAHYADVFLRPNNADGSPSNYAIGVSLGFQKSFGGKAAGVYALGAGDFKTSQDIWASKSGNTYGGRYIAPGELTKHLVPTRVTGGILQTDWTVAKTVTNVGGAFPYELSITLTASNSSAFSLLDGVNLDILWGTGDCANDPVYAEYKRPTRAPEPATIALLAGGLIMLRRRRRA